MDAAVRDYVEEHRDEINAQVAATIGRLDGSRASFVSEATGLSRAELDDLGRVPRR